MNPVLRKLKIQIGIYHQDLDPHNYKDNQGDKCYSWREYIKKNDSKAIQLHLKLSIKLGSEKKKVHSSEQGTKSNNQLPKTSLSYDWGRVPNHRTNLRQALPRSK